MQQSSGSSEHNPLGHFINSISSYDSNIMLAAVISLLLVILFVLLLHIYAKWFLAQARQRRRSSSAALASSHALLPSRFHHFHAFDTILSGSPPKGLDASVISAIPLFVYKQQEHTQGLECVICLTAFEENDVGRKLTKCDHSFHVECIDMWLRSHSNCPICRAPAVAENDIADDAKSTEVGRVSTEVHSSDGASGMVAVIDVSAIDNENGNPLMNAYALSDTSSPSSSSSLGSSLRRMLSRNRPDRKVFPSSSAMTEGTA